jgi:hypothetical protein
METQATFTKYIRSTSSNAKDYRNSGILDPIHANIENFKEHFRTFTNLIKIRYCEKAIEFEKIPFFEIT